MESHPREKRPVPWVGIVVTVIIILAILAFGIFKRKAGRIPPPIPEETVSHGETLNHSHV